MYTRTLTLRIYNNIVTSNKKMAGYSSSGSLLFLILDRTKAPSLGTKDLLSLAEVFCCDENNQK